MVIKLPFGCPRVRNANGVSRRTNTYSNPIKTIQGALNTVIPSCNYINDGEREFHIKKPQKSLTVVKYTGRLLKEICIYFI